LYNDRKGVIMLICTYKCLISRDNALFEEYYIKKFKAISNENIFCTIENWNKQLLHNINNTNNSIFLYIIVSIEKAKSSEIIDEKILEY